MTGMRDLPIERLLADLESGSYFARLVNNPEPHPLRKPPEVVLHRKLSSRAPHFTIVTPAFEHAETLVKNMQSIMASASLPFDWIVIDDGSTDATAHVARELLEAATTPLLAAATVLRNPVPIYETACDNLGFYAAETELVMEIQADIEVEEPAFDRLLARAVQTSPTPSAVSGRCGHTFAFLGRRTLLQHVLPSKKQVSIGLCGALVEAPDEIESIKGRLYRCETVNRGPWLVLKRDLERHGYLDERFFFLGNDDHDYHRRLFQAEARRPIYVPMSIQSPLGVGAARRERTGLNREVFEILRAEKGGSPGFRRFMKSLRPSAVPEEIHVDALVASIRDVP
jgi:glycosyltransferase involved in cell wall biosynthesis